MKNKKNKKKVLSIVALAACFVLCIGATFGITLAYFGGNSTASLGTVTLKTGIKINASTSAETSNTLVVPGQPVDIKATATVLATELGTPDAENVVQGFVRAKFTVGDTFGTVTIAGEKDGDVWVKGGDYYYLVTSKNDTEANSVLKPVSVNTVVTIVASLEVPTSFDNDDSGKQLTSSVVFEVVQAELYDSTGTLIQNPTVANATTSGHVVNDAFTMISGYTGETKTA